MFLLSKVFFEAKCASAKLMYTYTANVCRDLQGLWREIGVQCLQIHRDCMYTRNPCIFWSKSKKVWTFYIYTLLRFFIFPYNFCGDFRRTCIPLDNYMHFTGYFLQHGDPPHSLWGKNLQCRVSGWVKRIPKMCWRNIGMVPQHVATPHPPWKKAISGSSKWCMMQC